MDPIESINPKKDSTLAMMLAAQGEVAGRSRVFHPGRTSSIEDGQVSCSRVRLWTLSNDMTSDGLKFVESKTVNPRAPPSTAILDAQRPAV